MVITITTFFRYLTGIEIMAKNNMRKVGSNQYKSKYKKDIGAYLIGFEYLMIVMVALYVVSLHPLQSEAQDTKVNMTPPVQAPAESQQVVANLEATPAEIQTPLQEKIENEVKEVFGDAYPQAKMILDCENHARNPKAINDNTKWGGRGVDHGIFQINDSWQGVTNKAFLEDYTINIRMAYNIYKSWGNNFHAWTCGKKLGI